MKSLVAGAAKPNTVAMESLVQVARVKHVVKI
jgi:hypothetical protein